MKSHRRTPTFDSLESVMLLSTMHPGVAHPAAHQQRLPPFVRDVVQAARQRFGNHVTVTPTIAVPGGFAEYDVTFQFRGKSYTTVVTVPYHGPKYGPQPG